MASLHQLLPHFIESLPFKEIQPFEIRITLGIKGHRSEVCLLRHILKAYLSDYTKLPQSMNPKLFCHSHTKSQSKKPAKGNPK